jgi:hypothetical protein
MTSLFFDDAEFLSPCADEISVITIMIASNLATGENVYSNSIPSTCAYPLHTNLSLFLII